VLVVYDVVALLTLTELAVALLRILSYA